MNKYDRNVTVTSQVTVTFRSLLLFQVGCYYEVFGKQAEQFSALTGYQLKKKWRGFGKACGFHQRFMEKVIQKIEAKRLSYAVIQQTGKYLHYTMQRVPQFMVEFKNEIIEKEPHS
jgi:DNA mismatch repair ATPase MutS